MKKSSNRPRGGKITTITGTKLWNYSPLIIEFNNKRYEQKWKFYSWKLSINNQTRFQTHRSRKRSLKRNNVVLYSFPRIFARRTINRPLIPWFWRHVDDVGDVESH